MHFSIVLVISVIPARVTTASVIVCSTSFGSIICGIVMYLVQTSQYKDHSTVLDLIVHMLAVVHEFPGQFPGLKSVFVEMF